MMQAPLNAAYRKRVRPTRAKLIDNEYERVINSGVSKVGMTAVLYSDLNTEYNDRLYGSGSYTQDYVQK